MADAAGLADDEIGRSQLGLQLGGLVLLAPVVVQELRATLAEIEQQLDRFNRNADEREALTAPPTAGAKPPAEPSAGSLNP